MKLKAILLFSLISCSFFKSNEIQPMESFKKELVTILKNNKFAFSILLITFMLNKFKPFTFCYSEEMRITHYAIHCLPLLCIYSPYLNSKIKLTLFLYAFYNLCKFSSVIAAQDFIMRGHPNEINVTNENLNESMYPLAGDSFSTALIWACENNMDASVQLCNRLVSRNVDLNKQDIKFGRTALIWATVRKNLVKIKMLLVAGADTSIQDKDSKTFFDHLSQSEDKEFNESVYRIFESEEYKYAPKIVEKRKQITEKRNQIAQAIEDALPNVFPPELNQITASYCI